MGRLFFEAGGCQLWKNYPMSSNKSVTVQTYAIVL